MGGTELKQARIVEQVVAGSKAILLENDKASFYADNIFYIYESDDSEGKVVEADGSTTITVNFREAEKYAWTAKSNVGTYTVSGETYEGTSASAKFTKYQLVEGVLWNREPAKNTPYVVSFDVTENNQEYIIEYANTEIPAIFYSEVEDIEGMTTYAAGNAEARCSQCAVGYSATNKTLVTSLPRGKYKIVASFYSPTSAGGKFNIYTGQYGTRNIWEVTTTNNNATIAETEFVLPYDNDILLGQGSSTQAVDYIYIQSLGEPTEEEMYAAWDEEMAASRPFDELKQGIDEAEYLFQRFADYGVDEEISNLRKKIAEDYEPLTKDYNSSVEVLTAAKEELEEAIEALNRKAYENLHNASMELDEAIGQAKYIETDGKNGAEELAAAIATAESVDRESYSKLIAAKAALEEAIEAFEEANPENTFFAISDYLVNADFSSTEEWTAYASGTSGTNYQDYSNGLIGTYNVRFSPATVDDTHLATEYCFGFECRWQTNYASYNQETTQELPAGAYKLTFDVENVNGSTTKASYDNLFYVKVGETTYTDNSTEWMNGKSSWTTHTIEFVLKEPAKATVSFGYGTGSNNIGASNTPALYVSHLKLTQSDLLLIARGQWRDAMNDAQKALDEVGSVTGSERIALQAEIAKEKPTTVEGFDVATEALVSATNTFNDAKSVYDYNIELPFADATKRPIITEETTAATLIPALRAYYESNAAVEGVDGAEDKTELIVNPKAEDGTNGWTINKGTYNKGNVDVKNNEPWTSADESTSHQYFDGGSWGDSAWDVMLSQQVTLPAGRYALSAITRGATEVTMTLFAGDTKKEVETIGNTGGVFNRGWNITTMTFRLLEEQTVNIGVKGDTKQIYQWMSFSDFRLFCIGGADGASELAVAEELAADDEAVAVGKLRDAIAAFKAGGTKEDLQAAIDQFNADNADLENGETAKAVYAQNKAEMVTQKAKADALYANEYKTEGKDALNDAIGAAAEALASNKLNIAELEAEIQALKDAIETFTLANYVSLNGYYYVQNVATNKFMAAGHEMGSRGIVNDIGLDMRLYTHKDKSVYFLSDVSKGGSYVYLGSGLFMDEFPCDWFIEQVSEDTYSISNGTLYLTVDDDDNLALSEEADEWKFITSNDMFAARLATLEDATEENGVDATFLLKCPNFNRNDQRVKAWKVSDDCTDYTLNDGNMVNNCAGSMYSVFTISQTVTGVPAGIYKMTVQGFYRQDDDVTEPAPLFFAGNETAEVPVINGTESSMVDASVSFTNGLYTIDPIEFVVDDGILTVGVKNETAVHQWVVFDNFQLTYYGPVPEILLGDANLDGDVSTTDAVLAVSFALERVEPTDKQFKAADVNKTNTITVADAVGIVNIAMNVEPEAEARGEEPAVNYLTMENKEIGLVNTTGFSAFQMDVTLSDGAVLGAARQTERTAGMLLTTNKIGGNTWRIVALSLDGSAISGSEGSLLSLDIVGQGSVSVSNIEFADRAARAYKLDFELPTGINSLYNNKVEGEVYSVSGARSNSVKKGINVVRQADGKVRKVLVK